MNALSQQRPEAVIQEAMTTPAKVMGLGIDIAQRTHVVRAVRGTGERLRERFSCTSDPDDLVRLADWIRSLKERRQTPHLFVGMEPTGLFWYPVYEYLKDALPECGVYMVLPVSVHYGRRIGSSNRSKSDPQDAFVIARLVIQGHCRRPIQHTELTRQLRDPLRMYKRAGDDAVKWKRQVTTLLQRVFPEALQGVRESAADGVLDILRSCPAPADIRAVPEEQWIEERVKPGRSRSRLRAFYRKAQNSMGTQVNAQYWRATWDIAWAGWLAAKENKAFARAAIESLIEHHPATPLLRTIPGISDIAVAAFFAGAGDLAQYDRAAQVEKAFGFDLQRCQSGKMEATPHITKRGYKIARWAFYMSALRASQTAPFDARYQRRIPSKKEKGKRKAVIALAAKLVRIAFQVARAGEPFDASRAVSVIEHE